MPVVTAFPRGVVLGDAAVSESRPVVFAGRPPDPRAVVVLQVRRPTSSSFPQLARLVAGAAIRRRARCTSLCAISAMQRATAIGHRSAMVRNMSTLPSGYCSTLGGEAWAVCAQAMAAPKTAKCDTTVREPRPKPVCGRDVAEPWWGRLATHFCGDPRRRLPDTRWPIERCEPRMLPLAGDLLLCELPMSVSCGGVSAPTLWSRPMLVRSRSRLVERLRSFLLHEQRSRARLQKLQTPGD
jgi:hypothetical protein